MPRERRREVSSLSLPLSLPPSLCSLPSRGRRYVFTFGPKQDDEERRTATDYKLLARSEEERPQLPSVLSDSARASERSVWSGVTAAYYVCLVGGGALQQSSPPSPLHFNAAFKFLVGAHSERQ